METIQDTLLRVALPVGGDDPAANIAVVSNDELLLERLRGLVPADRYRLLPRRRVESVIAAMTDRRVDAALVDLRLLPDASRLALGRHLRQLRSRSRIPAIGLCDSSLPEDARLLALEDGFWDVIEVPTGSGELVAKLRTWINLKRDIDGLRAGHLVDVETGHYTPQGVRRRLREMTALAQRMEDPLSCAVFAPDPPGDGQEVTAEELGETGRHFALALHHQTRSSDVVGRLEPLKFLILAPHTPLPGGVKLAERFTTMSVVHQLSGAYPLTFSAGVAGIERSNAQVQAQPELLLAAALRALAEARRRGSARVAVVWEYPGQAESGTSNIEHERGTSVEERA